MSENKNWKFPLLIAIVFIVITAGVMTAIMDSQSYDVGEYITWSIGQRTYAYEITMDIKNVSDYDIIDTETMNNNYNSGWSMIEVTYWIDDDSIERIILYVNSESGEWKEVKTNE